MKKLQETGLRSACKAIIAILAVSAMLSFFSCQQFFTTSPLDDLQRDPGSLTDEQYEALAKAALETGDTDEIAEIYDGLGTLPPVEDDPDIYILAGELGMGGSGMTDLIDDIIEDEDATFTYAEIDAMLAGLNAVYINEAADNLLALQAAIDGGLVSGVNIPDEDLLSAATGMVAVAILLQGGAAAFETAYPGGTLNPGAQTAIAKAEALLAAMDVPGTVSDIGSIMGLTL